MDEFSVRCVGKLQLLDNNDGFRHPGLYCVAREAVSTTGRNVLACALDARIVHVI